MSSSTSLCINSLHTHTHLTYLSSQTEVCYTRSRIYMQWCKHSKSLHHIYTESNTILQHKNVLSKTQCTKQMWEYKAFLKKNIWVPTFYVCIHATFETSSPQKRLHMSDTHSATALWRIRGTWNSSFSHRHTKKPPNTEVIKLKKGYTDSENPFCTCHIAHLLADTCSWTVSVTVQVTLDKHYTCHDAPVTTAAHYTISCNAICVICLSFLNFKLFITFPICFALPAQIKSE